MLHGVSVRRLPEALAPGHANLARGAYAGSGRGSNPSADASRSHDICDV